VSLRRWLSPGRLLLGGLGLALGVGGVLALREATLSTHGEEVAPRIELVVSARTRGGEVTQTLAEMVEAQVLGCRLEVNSDLAGPIEDLGDRRFRAVLAPSLDETNRRQFRGCLEDWVIDHLQLQVLRLDEPATSAAVGEGQGDEGDEGDDGEGAADGGARGRPTPGGPVQLEPLSRRTSTIP
jgi:hypothetical protein